MRGDNSKSWANGRRTLICRRPLFLFVMSFGCITSYLAGHFETFAQAASNGTVVIERFTQNRNAQGFAGEIFAPVNTAPLPCVWRVLSAKEKSGIAGVESEIVYEMVFPIAFNNLGVAVTEKDRLKLRARFVQTAEEKTLRVVSAENQQGVSWRVLGVELK